MPHVPALSQQTESANSSGACQLVQRHQDRAYPHNRIIQLQKVEDMLQHESS